MLRTPEEDEEEDWRTFHSAWSERHQLAKRGFGTTDNWWLDRFNILLSGASGGSNYGLTQSWSWNQVLYSAEKNCPPSATAYMEAVILGELTAQLDYGISLIGTLRNFDFSESYAFFRLNGLDLSTKAELNGNAGFTFQSQTSRSSIRGRRSAAASTSRGFGPLTPTSRSLPRSRPWPPSLAPCRRACR